jgi:hypothetical protein
MDESMLMTIPNEGKPIMFAGYACCVRTETYAHKADDAKDRIAIILEDISTAEQVAVATVNVPNEPLADDEVIIKDYSENEGMLHTLIMAKIISVPERYTKTGMMPVCKLRIPLPK